MVDYIRNNKEIDNVFFYAQPHSFTYYSFIHRPIKMDFISNNAYEKLHHKGDWYEFEDDKE